MEAQMSFLLRGWRVWRRVWVEFPQLQRMESIPVGAVGGMATIWRATFPFCARKIGLWFYEWKTDA